MSEGSDVLHFEQGAPAPQSPASSPSFGTADPDGSHTPRRPRRNSGTTITLAVCGHLLANMNDKAAAIMDAALLALPA